MERLFDLYDDRSNGPVEQRAESPSSQPATPPDHRALEPRPASPRSEDPSAVMPARPPLAREPARRVKHVGADEPLATRMRPRSLDEYVGQDHLLGPDRPLRAMLLRGELPSLVLWGPSGCGKTSLGHVIAVHASASWVELSAADAGRDEIRRVAAAARERHLATGRRTVLCLDEIHRLSPSEQDELSRGIQDGTILLVGATTENPVFELSAPLMSRCKLVQLNKLEPKDVRTIVHRAVDDQHRGVGVRAELGFAALRQLVSIADGDARAALDALEVVVARTGADPHGVVRIEQDDVRDAVKDLRADEVGVAHVHQINAFVRSMRASDPDATVYWLLRLVESGEDPGVLARRMIMFASEDIGLADPQALQLAVAAADAVERVGTPEGQHALVQAALALAVAPKSDSVRRALIAGTAAVEEAGNTPVPHHLRDEHGEGRPGVGSPAPGRDPHPRVGLRDHLPEELHGRHLYEPSTQGHEAPIAQRVAAWREHSESAGSRRRSARAARQGGSIEGLDRAAWTRGAARNGVAGYDDGGDDPQGRHA